MLLLKDIIIILFSAIVIILILSKFRIPPIIGFLLTGVLIGPSAFKLVESTSEIEFLAEIGIVLLMFTIGLEFSLDRIRSIFKDFLFFGGSQVFLSWLAFFYFLYQFGLEIPQAILAGFVLALSSTAIVLKILQDGDDLNSPSGSKIIAILLFQDAVVIPAMILIPFLGQISTASPIQIATDLSIAFGGVVLVFFSSKILFPFIFKIIIGLRIPDLLTVTIFVFLFGISLAAHSLGISLAMGAFIVGIAISDSEYAHQINTDIIPSRHIFNSIFFISIGMFIDITFFFGHFSEIIIITFLIIILKILVILIVFSISKFSFNTGSMAAFGLAHIGELAFIILTIARQNSFFDPHIHQTLLSSSILSMFTIPFALMVGKKISGYDVLKKKLKQSSSEKKLVNHTIIAGFGVNGQNIARILKLLGISYTIAEMNPSTVKKYKSLNEPIHFGNIDRIDNMKRLGIAEASLIVIAVSDRIAAGRTVALARNLNPTIKIIVRANYLTQVEGLYKKGADLVLSQDMETSLISIHHILKFYNMPDHISRIQTNLLRKEHYRFFVKGEDKESWKVAMLDFVEQDNELFFIGPYSKHVSSGISDLGSFKSDGMNIIGVIRKNQVLTESIEEIVIEKFDTIIFGGNHKKVTEALTWMEENN